MWYSYYLVLLFELQVEDVQHNHAPARAGGGVRARREGHRRVEHPRARHGARARRSSSSGRRTDYPPLSDTLFTVTLIPQSVLGRMVHEASSHHMADRPAQRRASASLLEDVRTDMKRYPLCSAAPCCQ